MNTELFQGTVEKYKKIRHIRTQEQLRLHTTVGSHNTFKRYFEDPELMPIGVFNQIMNCLNVPQEERLEIFK